MKKETLKEMVVRIIKEESGKVTAKPIAKKGESVKVFNIYKNRNEIIQPAADSKYNEDWETYLFQSRNGVIVTYDEGGWVIDPTYQE